MSPLTIPVAEAAELLGISPRMAYDLARRDGQLAPGVNVFKVGSLWKVSRQAIDDLVGQRVAS